MQLTYLTQIEIFEFNKSKIIRESFARLAVDLLHAIKPSSSPTVSTIIIPRKTRSSSNQSRGNTVTCVDSFVNDVANEFLTKCLLDHSLTHEGVDSLAKKSCEMFVWCDKEERLKCLSCIKTNDAKHIWLLRLGRVLTFALGCVLVIKENIIKGA